MNIIINEKEVSKVELLALIKKNKLKAIKSLRKFAHIGLKDAVFIVENLKKDLNYFDTQPVKSQTSGYDETIESTDWVDSNHKKPIAGSHFLKPNRSNKLLIFGIIGFVFFLIYFFIKDLI